MAAYWRLALRRALTATLIFYGLHSRPRALFSISALVLAFAVLWLLPGGPTQMNEEIRWIAAIGIAAAIIFLPVFLWNVFTASAAIYQEQESQLAGLHHVDDEVATAIRHLGNKIVAKNYNAIDLFERWADDFAIGLSEITIHHRLRDLTGDQVGKTSQRLLSALSIENVIHAVIEPGTESPATASGPRISLGVIHLSHTDYYLSDLGKAVIRRLREGNSRR